MVISVPSMTKNFFAVKVHLWNPARVHSFHSCFTLQHIRVHRTKGGSVIYGWLLFDLRQLTESFITSQPWPFLNLLLSFLNKEHKKSDVSEIWARIVRVEGMGANHFTTNMAQLTECLCDEVIASEIETSTMRNTSPYDGFLKCYHIPKLCNI